MTRPVFILCGPTASGKSSLALELAKIFPFEIVNADSLQFFRHLDIGTAKPTAEELRSVPHHLIDVLNPDETATAGWFARELLPVIAELEGRKKVPLVVGGSGFYLQAVERPPLAAPTSFRSAASEADYEFLRTNDPEAAERIHPNDPYRIARAVSLLKGGERPSERWKRAKEGPPRFPTVWLGLHWNRGELYRRIDRRMERMFEGGLIEETRSVAERFPASLPRLARAIGYKQALDVLRNGVRREAALAEAQTKSRQYAKRQMTWFRRESRISWISGTNSLAEARQAVERSLPA